MRKRHRRIEGVIEAIFTVAAIIIIVAAVCAAGYVLGPIVCERATETANPQETAEPSVEEVTVICVDIATPVVTALPVQIVSELPVQIASEPVATEAPLWQDCNVPEYRFTQADVDAIARMIYGEARNCNVESQAGAVWCVLNRVDDPRFPDTVLGVVTQQDQFFGYSESHPVLPELVEVVEDVLMRYSAERSGVEDVGRVLPQEYLYFSGDGTCNYFTVTYASSEVWDWSLRSPYKDEW